MFYKTRFPVFEEATKNNQRAQNLGGNTGFVKTRLRSAVVLEPLTSLNDILTRPKYICQPRPTLVSRNMTSAEWQGAGASDREHWFRSVTRESRALAATNEA